MPPEIVGAFVLFVVATFAGLALVIRSASKFIANRFDIESEKQRVELSNLKRESAENAANSKFVLDAYQRMSESVAQQGKLIAALQADKESATRQLEESRKNNKIRDEQIGELRALLSRTASERDQERRQRERLEIERNAALAEMKLMEQEIKDLKSRVAELENKLRQRETTIEAING